MKRSLRREFGDQRPRAIVVDDHGPTRTLTARRLKHRGFDVTECSSLREFGDAWKPGLADVIVADWQLSGKDRGETILKDVRDRDWDVPFVLVSGKLEEEADSKRVNVLESLLDGGNARFIARGEAGIQRACGAAEELIEERDLGLLKVVLAMRPGAMAGKRVSTSSGTRLVADLLAEIVASPTASRFAEEPIASAWAKTRAQRRVRHK